MNKGLPENTLRSQKEEKLRKKISGELQSFSKRHKQALSMLGGRGEMGGELEKWDIELWNSIIKKEYALLLLQDFVNDPSCFGKILKVDNTTGSIIYAISEEVLDIMLTDDFCFVSDYLFHVADLEHNKNFTPNDILSSFFLEHNFISVVQRAMYKEQEQEYNR